MFYGKSRTYFLDEAAAVKAMQDHLYTEMVFFLRFLNRTYRCD